MTARRLSLNLAINADNTGIASAVLAEASQLSVGRVKSAMNKGAVRLQRGKRWRILRRASTQLRLGDKLSLNYDEDILAQLPLTATCIADEITAGYSVWHKPAGMLAQGTVWGDHCSLLRQVEKYFTPQRDVYLVHRLDREASGLMLIAHQRRAASALSQIFQQNKISKIYRAVVKGKPEQQGVIELTLDEKTARTEYRLLKYSEQHDEATLEVSIVTGRKHQIRRHLAAIGHPVMGDPAYGQHNKTPRGLQLIATRLAFTCPMSKQARDYREMSV